MAEFSNTAEFRGARFDHVDLSGATFRECDLRGVRITASEVADFHVSGFGGEIGSVVVNDVDVTAYVEAQLDERHPERVQLRAVRTADDYRAMWDVLEQLWAQTIGRAERLPEAVRHQRVNDEWSFVETLRHLVFAIDVWIGRMVREQPLPYHPFGLPPTDYPAAAAADIGIDLHAQPSFAEVLAMHADRRGHVREAVAAVTDEELTALRTAAPAPAWGEETYSVGQCLRVVLREHIEHRRFAERDLALLEADQATKRLT
jgi:uncharacterized damage-inducible protein DinB